MKTEINSEWNCPQCNAALDAEECEQAREVLKTRSQVPVRCDECGEELMADKYDCEEGQVQLLEMWNYE